jgi:hypothetical protein
MYAKRTYRSQSLKPSQESNSNNKNTIKGGLGFYMTPMLNVRTSGSKRYRIKFSECGSANT